MSTRRYAALLSQTTVLCAAFSFQMGLTLRGEERWLPAYSKDKATHQTALPSGHGTGPAGGRLGACRQLCRVWSVLSLCVPAQKISLLLHGWEL